MDQTPEQIIASAMQLSAQQRVAVAQQLLESVPTTASDPQGQLRSLLLERIVAAENGHFSGKSFAQIKEDARLNS